MDHAQTIGMDPDLTIEMSHAQIIETDPDLTIEMDRDPITEMDHAQIIETDLDQITEMNHDQTIGMEQDQVTENLEGGLNRKETRAHETEWMGLQEFNEGNLPIEWIMIMVAERMSEVDHLCFGQKD